MICDPVPEITEVFWIKKSITGTLPATIGAITSLEVLNLEGNKLGGSIPANIGLLTNLALLNLHNNLFTKSLPASVSTLSTLQVLQVGGTNTFTGTLPASLCSLPLTLVEMASQSSLCYAACLTGVEEQIGFGTACP